MELLALACRNCAAPLSVPANAKFVTCGHCGSQLAVHRTASVAYTELLEKIGERTEAVRSELEALRRDAALAELDRQWERQVEERFTVKDGPEEKPRLPKENIYGPKMVTVGVVGTLAAALLGGLLWLAGFEWAVFAVLFVLVGIVVVHTGCGVSRENDLALAYQKAKREYVARRRELSRRRTPDDADSVATAESDAT